MKVFKNCSVFLENQIRLFNPRFIVAIGNKAKQALTFDHITKTLDELGTPKKNMIKISFPLRAPNETDQDRIKKLRGIVI